MNIIVQASSRTWSGNRDICTNPADGKAAILRTVLFFLTHFPQCHLVVAAPEFDQKGELFDLLKDVGGQITFHFGEDSSPLKRMIHAANNNFESDFFLRTDGINFFLNPIEVKALWDKGTSAKLDCIKFNDDFPVQMTVDGYSRKALEKIETLLEFDSPFQIHPKYFLFNEACFDTVYHAAPPPSPKELARHRRLAKQLYLEERDDITGQSVPQADTLSLHYRMALEHIRPSDRLLDIACGNGHGTNLLADKVAMATGADLSAEIIQQAKASFAKPGKLQFHVQNAENTQYADHSFDIITSFETIEHVDDVAYLEEMKRILKPGGRLVISTPQNSYGSIPINSQHQREYSLEEFRRLFQDWKLLHLTGIKQGCIYFQDDPYGTNTFAVLKMV